MGRKRSYAKRSEIEWQVEEEELTEPEYQDRTLVLKRDPLPRKASLLASGVKEIRCLCCIQIKPLKDAEELGAGWICEDCLPDLTAEQRRAG